MGFIYLHKMLMVHFIESIDGTVAVQLLDITSSMILIAVKNLKNPLTYCTHNMSSLVLWLDT